jgi:bifunctional enzyme CysN/CysC
MVICDSAHHGKSMLAERLAENGNQADKTHLKSITTMIGKHNHHAAFHKIAMQHLQNLLESNATRHHLIFAGRRPVMIANFRGQEKPSANDTSAAYMADLVVVVVDAVSGISAQTRRQLTIASNLGICHCVLAVKNMDRVGYSPEVFTTIEQGFCDLVADIGGMKYTNAIPLSAGNDDNITMKSKNLDWFDGLTLIECLETIDVEVSFDTLPFRIPVNQVNAGAISGVVACGEIGLQDRIKIMPSAKEGQIKGFADTKRTVATSGQSVTIVLDDAVDIAIGDIVCTADNPMQTANQFEVSILWTAEQELYPGRPYLLQIGAKTIATTITSIKHKINVGRFAREPAKKLQSGEIGICNISCDQNIAFDTFVENYQTGGFALIDLTDKTPLGTGLIHFALRRSSNVHWQALEVDRKTRSAIKGHEPCVLWFTGLSGSGKSTIANIVEKKLVASNVHSVLLDGDNVRHGLNKDLGFTNTDRVENIRRIAEVSRLMIDAGLVCITSFISPFDSERKLARELVPDGHFILVHVNTPLEIAEQRDVKGLYKKARAGEIKNFTGIDSPYEAPKDAEITINSSSMSNEEAADKVIAYLLTKGIVDL